MRKTTSSVASPRPQGKSRGKKRTRSARDRTKKDDTAAKRDATTGRFGKGNSAALKHGLARYAAKRTLTHEDVRAEVERFMAQVVSDQGELTAIRSGYVRNLATVETLVQLAVKDLRANGLHTEKGRTRQMVFTLMQFLDRWDRYAQRLGMERRQKRVESLEDFLQQNDEGDQA